MQNYSKRIIFTAATSVAFVFGIVFIEELYNELWIFSYLILLPVFLLQISLFFLNLKTYKTALLINIAALVLGIGAYTVLYTEVLKSKIIVKAYLIDDLSSIQLSLRENHSFELTPQTFSGSTEKFSGKYVMKGNQVIFLNRPYDNYFIPDTIYLLENKLILRFDSEGNPDTSFANYFEIRENNIKAENLK